MKRKATIGYLRSFFTILVIITLMCTVCFLGYLLYLQNNQAQNKITDIYKRIEDAVESMRHNDNYTEDSVYVISIPQQDNPSSSTLTEALSLMQNQYDTYLSKLAMLLTISFGGIAFFSIVIPLFNYVFIHKEQILKLNKSLLENETHFNEQIKRLENAIIQTQQVNIAVVDETALLDIDPISGSNIDKASAYYIQATIANSRQRHDIALQYIAKAIEIDPNNPCYQNSISITLCELVV